jgi:hypothetical protein
MLSGPPTETNEIEMVDPAYLRRQAELCFALAQLMTSTVDSKLARLAAEQYARRAENAEQEQSADRSSGKASG